MTTDVIFKGKNTLRTSLATLWEVLFKENDFLAVYIAKRLLICLTLDIVLWMQSKENLHSVLVSLAEFSTCIARAHYSGDY